MHEYSLVTSLLETAVERAAAHGARAVTRVDVRIGESSGVDADLFQTAFEVVSLEDGLCRGASLRIQRVPASWRCTRCDRGLASGDDLACRECGSPATLVTGDELVLDRLELEMAT